MAENITEVMALNPCTLNANDSCADAAKLMRDRDVGDVLVLDDNQICGVVTDRDIVVRCIAEGHSPRTVALGEICSRDLVILETTDTVDDAIKMMRKHAVRRLPIVDHGQPVGVVSLGDLAIQRDPNSVLGNVSAAPPNS